MGFIGKQPAKAAITSSDITDGVVTADKLASDSVTTAKIADNGVTTAKINADAVTDAKIADDVVGTEHLTAGEVDTTALGADAVTAAKVADDAISDEHLDVTAITGHTAETSVADGDTILIHDASASALRKMTKANFTAGVGLAECSFRAYQSSSQGIPNATSTQVNLDTEDWDTDNAFASNTFTCPSDKAGKYIVVGAVRADPSWANTDQFNVMIYRNGASNTGGMSSSQVRGGVGHSGISVSIIDMAAGDTLKLYLYHNEGGSESLQTGQESTYFAGTRITS